MAVNSGACKLLKNVRIVGRRVETACLLMSGFRAGFGGLPVSAGEAAA
jgi:hypothetical protein